MRILLVGNFAPPYEEENLHNISLLKKLESDGHRCTVLNISENPSSERKFIDSKSVPDFVLKLFQYCKNKDVVHFSTKGYLRVGLLKMMASIFVGKLLGVKTIITFHSELFSVLGQMRSPFGGTQTLNTSFFLVDKIICHDRDTYDVACMYKKKPNFELIPSFVHVPADASSDLQKLSEKEKVIVFSNVLKTSFSYEILSELLSANYLDSDTGIVISLPEKNSVELQRALEEAGKEMMDSMIFIKENDLQLTLQAYSKAALIVRPLSCDGETFFDDFSVSIKKSHRIDDNIYFPGGLALFKEGKTARMCADMINTILSSKPWPISDQIEGNPYSRILEIYKH